MTLPTYGDTPDFERTLASSPTSQSFDTGEDTTRLLMGGGSNSRSGRWTWATGFESGNDYTLFYGLGGNGKIFTASENGHVYQGVKALEFLTSNLTPEDLHIFKNLYIPYDTNSPNRRVGLEAMVDFMPTGAPVNNTQEFSWEINFPFSAAESYVYKIVLVSLGAGNGSLYTDNNGVRTFIADVNKYVTFTPGAGFALTQFHFTKLVVNGKTNRYERFYFDDLIFPLSQAGFVNPLPTNGQGVEFRLRFKTLQANLKWAFVDNWIISGDEP